MIKVITVLAVSAAVVATGCGSESKNIQSIPKTEVKGIITLDDNKDGNGPVSDLAIADAISSVAADCDGQVLLVRGNYVVTVYCSPVTHR